MKNGMRTCSLIIVMIVLIFVFLSDEFSRNTVPVVKCMEKHKVSD